MNKKLLNLLAECRPLFVAETTDPYLWGAHKVEALGELAELDAVLTSGELSETVVLHAWGLADSEGRAELTEAISHEASKMFPETFPSAPRSGSDR